jgi:hypothetical protein
MQTAPTNEQWRHQDYVFTVPDLDAGQLIQIPFQFDADYPFQMHGMAARVPYSSAQGPTLGTQAGLNLISARWSAQSQDYRQDGLVPLNLLLGPYFGQVGNPHPVYPPIRWPRSGFITLDVQNNGPNAISGLQFFFRGVKVGSPGSWATYTYPAKQQRPPLPFLYPSNSQSIPLLTLPVTGPPLRLVPFVPDNDSDFVFRFGQAGSSELAAYEIFITLRDEGQKPYSNAPVHVDVLFGRSGFPLVFPCGPATFVAPVGPGASQPGLLVPEIYIPRNHRMMFDIVRDDSAYAGAAQINYPLTFGGMKVFPA